jgi:hypothetical protein
LFRICKVNNAREVIQAALGRSLKTNMYFLTVVCLNTGYCCVNQGRREVGGGPGQIFFRGPYLKYFSGKNFFWRTTSHPPRRQKIFGQCTILYRGKKFFRTSALQLLSRDFISFFYAKFRYLAQKNGYLVLC